MQYSLNVLSFAVSVASTSYKTAGRKHLGCLAVVFLAVEPWLEAILYHLMMSNTVKRFWGWGRFLSCWLFSGLLPCSFLSLWIFRLLDWLKCYICICRDKSSIQILGSRSALGQCWIGKNQNWLLGTVKSIKHLLWVFSFGFLRTS